MKQSEFASLCEWHGVAPSIALENEPIKDAFEAGAGIVELSEILSEEL